MVAMLFSYQDADVSRNFGEENALNFKSQTLEQLQEHLGKTYHGASAGISNAQGRNDRPALCLEM